MTTSVTMSMLALALSLLCRNWCDTFLRHPLVPVRAAERDAVVDDVRDRKPTRDHDVAESLAPLGEHVPVGTFALAELERARVAVQFAWSTIPALHCESALADDLQRSAARLTFCFA